MLQSLNLDDFKVFWAVARTGSFARAASELGTTQPTVSRRIRALEDALGTSLFERSVSGANLTNEARTILADVQSIAECVERIQSLVGGADARLAGEVTLALTEGLATHWIAPRLSRFQGAHPLVALALQTTDDPAGALKGEADLALSFGYPADGDLKSVKLGRLHFVPWASRRYLELYGAPACREALRDHRLLSHASYRHGKGDWPLWASLANGPARQVMVSNSSSALYAAIRNGTGIGLLPTYAIEVATDIVPLDLGLKPHSDMVLLFRAEARHRLRVRAVIDWLKTIFSESESRWFRDSFEFPARAQ